jgi:NAD(P)H-flavin reductase
MSFLSCEVDFAMAISDSVYRVRLVRDPSFSFRAGQYLMVVMDERDKHPLSIASTPTEQSYIEIHVGAPGSSLHATALMDRIRRERTLVVDIPHGEAWFRENSPRPLVLIADGAGFAYVRSILLAALAERPAREVSLYWGGLELRHLYDLGELGELSVTYPQLNVIPVVERPEADWRGRSGNLLSAVLKDFDSLSEQDIYIAGHLENAKNAREQLCAERGALKSHIHGDAFAVRE